MTILQQALGPIETYFFIAKLVDIPFYELTFFLLHLQTHQHPLDPHLLMVQLDDLEDIYFILEVTHVYHKTYVHLQKQTSVKMNLCICL